MDCKTKAAAGGRVACALVLAAALIAGVAPQLVRPLPAHAAELQAGQWQTLPTLPYAKLAKRVDEALAAQDPKPQVKTTTSKRSKTVTVTVSCKAKKAGVQDAKSKKERAYASLAMTLYAGNLYRSETSANCPSAKKTLHGVNNYGKDRASDYSLNVGRDGTAQVYLRYEGILGLYKNGTFRKANLERELYFNQTRAIQVASVDLPQGYRLKIQLRRR